MRYLPIAVGLLLAWSFSSATASTPERARAAVSQAGSVEKLLAAMSSNTAKSAGQMIDAQTQLTGAASVGKTMVHYLVLVNYERQDIPNIAEFRAKVASTLSKSVCTAPIASTLINEYGAEYKYIAYSKSRAFLFEYAFNKTTCSSTYRW